MIRYVPNGDEVDVPMDVVVSATFNKPVVNVSTFTFKVTRRDTNTWHAAYVSYDEETRTAYLMPTPPLEQARTYVATLTSDIVDERGAPLVGTTSWMFTVAPDTTPPAVTMISPAADATGVPVDATVEAAFSEPVLGATNGGIGLRDAQGVSVFGASVYITESSVRFTPTIQLAPHATYKASLTSAITDAVGNPLMDSPVEWVFTTGADTVPPEVFVRFPEIDDTDIPLTAKVTVRFTEPVVGVSADSMTLEEAGSLSLVPASVTYDSFTRTAKLTPSAPLAPNTTYTVRLTSAITDTSGNPPLVPITWSFTTGSQL